MYIPKSNILSDANQAIEFMQRFNFAIMITSMNGRPEATHLPFIVTKKEDGIYLNAHMARANKQWKTLTAQEVLIIFSEPHAYISPSLYNQQQNVPTWDYVSVHAYGKTRLIEEDSLVLTEMESMIDLLDKGYKKQWKTLDPDYIARLLKGVVAFQIKIHDLQAKEKISQDRTILEKTNIINSLDKSSLETDRLTAEYMRKKLD